MRYIRYLSDSAYENVKRSVVGLGISIELSLQKYRKSVVRLGVSIELSLQKYPKSVVRLGVSIGFSLQVYDQKSVVGWGIPGIYRGQLTKVLKNRLLNQV